MAACPWQAVGITFAFTGKTSPASMLHPILLFGLVSFLFSVTGNMTGVYFGKRCDLHMELWGGMILIGIGIKILIEHLL